MNIHQSPAWPTFDSKGRRVNIETFARINALELRRPQAARIGSFFADLKAKPEEGAGLEAQILHGEEVDIFAQADDWSLIQSKRNLYIGWTKSATISHSLPVPTHKVLAPRSFLYPQADMKSPRCGYRSMGSLIAVTDEVSVRGTDYYKMSDGNFIIAKHAAPVSRKVEDYVSFAERMIHTPYLWGGDTAFGIDCSGLVSLSLNMAGIDVMRDSDMQAATIGKIIDIGEDWNKLQRGDLVFWRGHVAIAQGMIEGIASIIHANGYTMDVTSEPVEEAVKRIAFLYEKPIGVRRLF